MSTKWIPWLLFSSLAAVAAEEAPPSAANEGVSVKASLSSSSYGKGRRETLLLKLDYVAETRAPARPPLDIALVLDRSASMNEDRKFRHALTAAREVVANMTELDVLSIVAFNENVTVLSPAARVVNKPYLYHRLEEVQPQGVTDLSAGLLEGIAQVDSQRAEGQIRHVLLLTDGMANRGVTDPAALRTLVEKAASRDIHLSTLGCGTEFNEKLLADMATAGGGRYTFVRSAEQLPEAFAAEMHGLIETVAQNVTLRVAVRGGRISKVFGRLLDDPVASYRLGVGDVRAAERGAFLLELEPAEAREGASLDAEVTLTFDDPRSSNRVSRTSVERSAYSPSAAATADRPDVIMYGEVLHALELAEEAALGLDTDRFRKASADFDRVYDRARRYAIQSRDQELLNQAFVLKHFMRELTSAEREGVLHGHEEARDRLRKEGHYRRYLLSHHRGQQ